MSKRLTAWLVPLLMVLIAIAHGWRVVGFGESPWIGAGFGMFAEVDGPQRVTEVRLVSGEERLIPSLSAQELERLSNFPSPGAMERFVGEHEQVVAVSILRPAIADDLTVTWEVVASFDSS